MCIATRTVRPESELLRFALAPDGDVVPDLKRRLPGRGAWVSAERAAVEKAERKRLFSRAFETEARAAPGLADRVERLLEQTALSALGLARKAGRVVVGFRKVEAALARDSVVALVHASDAAPDGVRKIAAAVRRRHGDAAGEIPVIDCFRGEQLDLALGHPHVIHAALLAGGPSTYVLERVAALERFRGGRPPGPITHDERPPGMDARDDTRDE